MANRYFTGSTGGLWSVLTNWDNYPASGYPTSVDVVYSNARTIYVDTGITVTALYNSGVTGPPAITNGGGFVVDYRCGNVVINADLVSYDAIILTTRLVLNQTLTINGSITSVIASSLGALTCFGLGVINIFGNIYGSNNGGTTNAQAIRNLGYTTLNIVGDSISQRSSAILNESYGVINITGTPKTTSVTFGNAINNSSNGKVNIYNPSFVATGTANNCVVNSVDGVISVYGDINMPVASTTIITNTTNGTVNISGNCYGAVSGSTGSIYLVNNTSTGIVNVYGDVYASGRSVSSILGFINNASTGTINVYGNVRGGISANTIAISNTSTGNINVYGNISGGTFTGNTPAIYSTTAGFINVYGNCVAGSYPALYSSNTLATNVVGGLVFNTASTPYYAYNLKVTPTATTITTTTTTGNTKIFTTSGYTYGLPFSGDVRSGIKYGSVNEYTGSMVVPLKSSVKLGTLFDTGSTYGEAITNVNDLNVIFSSFTINYTGTT